MCDKPLNTHKKALLIAGLLVLPGRGFGILRQDKAWSSEQRNVYANT